ncbi:DUF2520 domain-containing protein [Undibacterium cyanobacteriorum]|uniref:DUF2520 domain-containing protein n=1 Tax=Undibacterium cyanobacteriorum TaxID=3073561 RepID=A0ABY9RJL6_9BURK|nr:DUF2520 domain-containing protein [Undibacterium sp. 20NA77.5]WMW80470.1 DUF2520 domain-containing protein [Undibacterium sp. 20NA77.5]
MRTLSIIGPGRVGRSLGKLFHQLEVFQITSVMSRSLESAVSSSAFIGAGEPVISIEQLSAADVFMLAVPDDEIEHQVSRLRQYALVETDCIVFHCSGSKSSSILAPLRECGAHVASVHPVRSFADPALVVSDFHGTMCGIEGDQLALQTLSAAFGAIGARVFELSPEHKLRYHAASVFASNYLVTLIDVAQQCYVAAGLDLDLAARLAQPLASKTLENCFRLGTTAALTGPIKRGDFETVQRQENDLLSLDRSIAELYKSFVPLTTEIAKRSGAE